MGVGPETRHAKSDLRGGLNITSPEFHRLVTSVVQERGFPYWQAKSLVLQRLDVLDGTLKAMEGDCAADANDPLTVNDIVNQGDPSDPETIKGELIGAAAADGVCFTTQEQNKLIFWTKQVWKGGENG